MILVPEDLKGSTQQKSPLFLEIDFCMTACIKNYPPCLCNKQIGKLEMKCFISTICNIVMTHKCFIKKFLKL